MVAAVSQGNEWFLKKSLTEGLDFMQISFDTENFLGGAKALTVVLQVLRDFEAYAPDPHKEVEEICCRTPSDALRYTQKVTRNRGISAEAEKVFIKNVGLGLRYLRYLKKNSFADPTFNQKFIKKVKRNPVTALEWSKEHGRLTEKEEEVFIKDFPSMREYAMRIIKGPFPEKIHNMILLKSFDSNLDSWQKKWLTDYVGFVERFNKKELTPADTRMMTSDWRY